MLDQCLFWNYLELEFHRNKLCPISWLPGQALERNTAVTAMILADTAAQADLHEGHRFWPHIQGWAEELGLTAPEAITRITQPPRDTSRHQEQATGQPDLEAAD